VAVLLLRCQAQRNTDSTRPMTGRRHEDAMS
jgi:hypothetical protein